MKENINLGDKNKFVAYGANGIKNCLELCKMVLKKHGLTSFGSSSNMFRLMHEQNGRLTYFTDSPKETYEQAINCIDKHLENNKPIIVGVNHTIGRNYNEGTTDHFVVIYGRIHDGQFYNYLYYEVGKTNVAAGYNDNENRFIYDTSNPDKPQFYDDKSSRSDGARFDVIQVRPNI